jgi:hypothetical protein
MPLRCSVQDIGAPIRKSSGYRIGKLAQCRTLDLCGFLARSFRGVFRIGGRAIRAIDRFRPWPKPAPGDARSRQRWHKLDLALMKRLRFAGTHDSGKRRQMLRDVLCVQVLLKSYGKQRDLDVKGVSSHVICYYGKCSIPKPFAITGSELDEHFGWPVQEAVDEVNSYFGKRLFLILSGAGSMGQKWLRSGRDFNGVSPFTNALSVQIPRTPRTKNTNRRCLTPVRAGWLLHEEKP